MLPAINMKEETEIQCGLQAVKTHFPAPITPVMTYFQQDFWEGMGS